MQPMFPEGDCHAIGSAAPADAAPEVRARVNWVSGAPGGRGAVREFIEMVLRAQNRWDAVVREYAPAD